MFLGYRMAYFCMVFPFGTEFISAVLGIVILSIRPSVCHTRALWRNERIHCRYFDTTWKGNHSSFLIHTEIGGRYIPFHLKFALKVTHPPFEKLRLRTIFAYKIWTIKASEKCSIIAIRSRPLAFQWAIDGVRTLPLTYLKGSSKKRICRFFIE